MNIVFFGSGEFGLPTLKRLAREHTVTGVVTQPDKPAGRSRQLTPTPIGEWAASSMPGVPLLKPENVNEPTVLAQVRAFPADAWVVIAFGQKLSSALLEGRFAINLHGSLLPRWRGAAPINHAVLAGDPATGNSVITLAQKMDAGLILGQSTRVITPLSTAGEMHDMLSVDGPELVLRVLDEFAQGKLIKVEQDPSKVTIAPKLGRADSWVDFAHSAEACRRRVHGLTPWPGVSIRIDGVELKLRRVQVEPVGGGAAAAGVPPGTLIDVDAGLIACGESSVLRLFEVQPPGRTTMSWNAFILGNAGKVHKGAVVTCARPS